MEASCGYNVGGSFAMSAAGKQTLLRRRDPTDIRFESTHERKHNVRVNVHDHETLTGLKAKRVTEPVYTPERNESSTRPVIV